MGTKLNLQIQHMGALLTYKVINAEYRWRPLFNAAKFR